MSNPLSKRDYGGSTARFQGEMERSLSRLQSKLTAADISFEPEDADWVSPGPTNLQDAINRIVANTVAGTYPIP